MTPDRDSIRKSLEERFPRDRGHLLPALHYLQRELGYLPDWAMEQVGRHLQVPNSEVYGAATSYTVLRTRKPGRHVLRVCTGLSCWMNGGRELMEAARRHLRLQAEETTSDGMVTLEDTPCGYLCAVAPALEWDGAWHGRVSSDRMVDLVRGADGT